MSTNHAPTPTRRLDAAQRLRRTAALMTAALVAAALALVGLGAAPASAANTVTDGWLTFQVTGPGGEPLQGADITVSLWDGDPEFTFSGAWEGKPIRPTSTSTPGQGYHPESGEYMVAGVPPDRIRKISILDHEGSYFSHVFDVDVQIVPGQVVDAGTLELSKRVMTGRAAAQVTAPGDDPIYTSSNLSFGLLGDDGRNPGGIAGWESLATGRLTFTEVAVGVHVTAVEVFDSANIYATARVPVDVWVPATGVVDLGTIPLSYGGNLSASATGGDPSAYDVFAYDSAGHLVASTVTHSRRSCGYYCGGDPGSRLLYNVSAGRISRLEFRPNGFMLEDPATYPVRSFDVDVTVPLGGQANVGPFDLGESLGRIEGTIGDQRFPLIDTVNDYHVLAYDGEGRRLGSRHNGRDGHFSIARIPAGSRVKKLRIVEIFDPLYQDQSFDVDIPVVADQTTRIDEPLRLSYAPTVVPSSVPRLAGPVRGVSGVVGSGRVGLSWVAPISDGGAPVTDFRVQYRPSAGGDWVSVDRRVSAATTASVTGLVNGTGYVFRVAAVTSAGVGAFSADSAVFTPALTAPAAPGAPTVTPGAGQVSLAWTAPADDGGSAVSDYRLRYRPAAGGDWVEVSDPVSAATSARISGLINGTGYVFQIAAANSAGTGAWSAASAPVIPAGSPAAPTGVNGVTGDGQVTLSWTGPAADNGSPVSDYRVAFRSASGGAWVDFGEPVSAARAATVTGLANGTGYVFRVAAVNSVGQGAWSADSTAVIPVAPARAPGVVTGVGGVAGDGQVALSWTAPAGPVTDYRIWYRPASSSGGWWMVHEHTPSAAPTATISGLANGTAYVFQVAAVNSVGQGAWSALGSPITPTAPTPTPTAPVPPAQQPSDSSPVMVDQHVAGGVPGQVKRKSRQPIALPKATDGGQRVGWSSATPRICKVVRGKLKLTGKKGVCRVTGSAPGTAQRNALRQAYAIRVR